MNQQEQDLFDIAEIEAINEEIKKEHAEENRLAWNEVYNLLYPEKKNKTVSPAPAKIFFQKQGELFDVGEIERVNQEIIKQKHDEENVKAIAALNLLHYENPKNDNEKLMNYQYQFLKFDDKKAWGDLLILAFQVTERLVYSWCKKNKIFMDKEAVADKTSIAVEYVLRRYKSQSLIGYCVQKNYIHALRLGVKHAMKYTTKIQYNTDNYGLDASAYLDKGRDEWEEIL